VNPFDGCESERPVCHGAHLLTHGELLRQAAALAGHLPAADRLVNLCESRSAFLVTFVASLLRRRPLLLPGRRTPGELAQLSARFSSTHVITDEDVRAIACESATSHQAMLQDFSIEARTLVLTGFTSGSTGESQPHDKHWQALLASCRGNGGAIRDALGVGAETPVSLLGTVPSHHMYGLELTVLLPLFGGMSVHDSRPLFPADVAASLAALPTPRVLVSTPLHLRALADSDIEFPALSLIVSASAPLEATLAARIEARLRAPLLEMFGSTETFVFATRRTVSETEWRLYEDIAISPAETGTRISAPWYPRDQTLHDLLDLSGERRFVLRGRSSDLIEVAGKRASLAEISRRLCAIPGVEDAVVYQPEAAVGTANRVAAAVVGKGVTERQIVESLAASLEPALIPRPLVFVDAIPRDALGKVSRARLLELMSPR
jgi:acyl-coenzyme A synthetase/AMP-(fatty) acid ligase